MAAISLRGTDSHTRAEILPNRLACQHGARLGPSHSAVCQTNQQPQGRSFRRQPRGLRIQATGGCSFDRGSCIARSVEELATSSIRLLLRRQSGSNSVTPDALVMSNVVKETDSYILIPRS